MMIQTNITNFNLRKAGFIFSVIGLFCLFSAEAFAVPPVNTDTKNLTAYYPAPYGAYERLRLVPRAALSGPCQTGTLYVQQPDILFFCGDDADLDGTGTWAPLSGVWTQSGNDLYPTDTTLNSNLFVGIGTATPTAKLTVNTQTAGEDVLSLTDQGALVLTVKDGGNVGINDPAPAARLSINNAGTEDILNLKDNGTEVFTVTDGGRIGIQQSSPSHTLHVGGDGQLMLDKGGVTGIRFNDSDGSPDFQMRFVQGQVEDWEQIVQETHNEFQLRFVDYPGEINPFLAMTLEKRTWPHGFTEFWPSLGICNENPTDDLYVACNGEAVLEAADPQIILYQKPTSAASYYKDDYAIFGGQGLLSFMAGDFAAQTWKKMATFSDATGGLKLGIYNETAAGLVDDHADYPLDVAGGINLRTTNRAGTWTFPGPSGYYRGGACLFGCSSSRELKTNIRPVRHSLKRVMALDPVSFEYQDPRYGRGVHYGLIAEDVRKVFPQWVHGNEPKNYSINYGPEIKVQVVRALQELQAEFTLEINQLTKENQRLQDRLKALERRNF